MIKKPKILTFVSFYLPGYKSGGPVRTIANMVDQLGDEIDFLIVTSDRDMLEKKPYSDININQWNIVGKAKVFYASSEILSFHGIKKIIKNTEFDLIYLNSFFSSKFSIYPILTLRLNLLTDAPIIIAPRGEFSKGALEIKRFKKNIYIRLSKILKLYNEITWQASSLHEEADILHTIGSNISGKIVVASDLPQKYSFSLDLLNFSHKREEPLKIIFLSRISPMKNLDYAINVLKVVKIPVVFNIYGMIDDFEYWKYCTKIIETIPENILVNFHGSVEHEKVINILAENHLFFLPTLGENYGHVIYESLAAGVPVLISDRTPWRNLEKHGVGWDISLENPEKFCQIIEEFSMLSHEECFKQKNLAIKYAENIAVDNNEIKRNLNLFTDLINMNEVRNV